MKKSMVFLFSTSFIIACGSSDGKDASKLANEVCECYKKANGMDAADPKRASAQDECLKKQGEAWNKIKDDEKRSDEFNKIIGDCGKDMIQKSFGQ
ncbi:MAG: hypothetical protein HZB42_14590 [Sphingobacteriales bacterium]|nr:hypothetical protein [Sphingobacteriales bacterium]